MAKNVVRDIGRTTYRKLVYYSANPANVSLLFTNRNVSLVPTLRLSISLLLDKLAKNMCLLL